MSKEEGNSSNHTQLINQITKQPKYSEEGILNKELFRNIEILDNENNQLKVILTELREDLKEKDNSIEESHKIINKLKDEYSKMIKNYQNLEKVNDELLKENNISKNIVENSKKTNDLINKLKEKNEDLVDENNRLKKENSLMKNKLTTNNNITNQKDQDLKEKELIINDLKNRGENLSSLIKEREKLISEQSTKIKELNEIIDRKEEQLKVMVNFSKEINKENKTNVHELTKQAVKTIKVFYNTLNNTVYNNIDSGNRIELKEEESPSEKFEDIIKQGRVSFSLEDGLSGLMYIPQGIKTISKEFLIDMNLKTELIKSELFSGLNREMHFINFLEQIFNKLNMNDMETIKNVCHKVISLKINYENLLKQNNYLKKENQILKQNIKNNDLYIQKLKENINNNLTKLKERYITLTMNIDSKVKTVKNNNIILKEKGRKDTQKLKTEIGILKNEITKLKKENLNLKNKIEEQIGEIDNKNQNINEINTINNNNENIIQKKDVILEIENINNFSYFGEKNLGFNKIENENDNNMVNNLDNLNLNYGNNINKNLNNAFNTNNFISENISKDFQNNIIMNDDLKNNNIEINNQENLNIIQNKNNNNIIQNNNIDDNYIQLQEMIKENEKYKEINSQKIEELQNLLSQEKQKNTELINELNSLKLYSEDLNKNISILKQNQSKISKKNIFTPNLFLKLFFKLNYKIFSSSEYKKYLQIYNLKDIYNICEVFKKTCETLKRKIYETHFEINTTITNTDMDEYLVSTNNNNSRRALVNSSYKAVNEKILKLKKFEFDMTILNEFVKNYMVSQESVIQIIFNSNNNVIQFEIIEKLYKLLEDGLNFKIDEMNDSVIFYRKLLIKFFKNQKNCLGLSLEYISE